MARARLCHQRSCNSATGAANSPSAVRRTSWSPPTVPIRAAGTPISFARSTIFVASCAAQEITIRFWLSPNHSAWDRGRAARPGLRGPSPPPSGPPPPPPTAVFPGHLLAEAALRERHGEPAFAAIVRALDPPGPDQAQEGCVQRRRRLELTAGWGPGSSARGSPAKRRCPRAPAAGPGHPPAHPAAGWRPPRPGTTAW